MLTAQWAKSSHSSANGCLEARLRDGRIEVRNSRHPDGVLSLTPHEWQCFLGGARDGDFDLPA